MAKRKVLNELPGLGPVSMALLSEIGVFTRADLEELGAVLAYRILKHRRPEVTLNMLYALHAALNGGRWDLITKEEKERLKKEADEVRWEIPKS